MVLRDSCLERFARVVIVLESIGRTDFVILNCWLMINFCALARIYLLSICGIRCITLHSTWPHDRL